MHLSALMPCRNEAWILGLSARAVLQWVDSLVILNHASTDETTEIIHEVAAEHPGRVIALHEPDPIWAEMRHRQLMLDTARANRATHIAIVDADEVLTGNLLPTIRGYFESLVRGQILQLPWLCCWRSIDKFRDGDSSVWSNNWVSTGFVDNPIFHWTARNGYDFHHRQPMGRPMSPRRPVPRVDGGLLHFQHSSWRRLLAKQCLYQLTEVVRWPDRSTPQNIASMYGGTVDETGLKTSPVPESWWAPYRHLMKYLDLDREPWQESACQRLMSEYGAAKFQGLNLFGVA